MWYVYILRCGDGSLYTGVTTDMARRLRQHRTARGAKYTRGRGPLRLRYWEAHATKGRALSREHAIKRLPRVEKMRLLSRSSVHRFIRSRVRNPSAAVASQFRNPVVARLPSSVRKTYKEGMKPGGRGGLLRTKGEDA
ncbi:MAG: GIY-YIG nuclease family protein, partial [Planctomycetes bacterium]|nr:GIY-YIG nuclease family protein [Planctomycetota bacterium]